MARTLNECNKRDDFNAQGIQRGYPSHIPSTQTMCRPCTLSQMHTVQPSSFDSNGGIAGNEEAEGESYLNIKDPPEKMSFRLPFRSHLKRLMTSGFQAFECVYPPLSTTQTLTNQVQRTGGCLRAPCQRFLMYHSYPETSSRWDHQFKDFESRLMTDWLLVHFFESFPRSLGKLGFNQTLPGGRWYVNVREILITQIPLGIFNVAWPTFQL